MYKPNKKLEALGIYEELVAKLENGLELHKVESELKARYPLEKVRTEVGDDPLKIEAFYSREAAEVRRRFLERRLNLNLENIREDSLEYPPVEEVKDNGKALRRQGFSNYLGGGKGGRLVAIVGPLPLEIKVRDNGEELVEDFWVPLRPSRYGIVEGVSYGLKLIRRLGEGGRIRVEVEPIARVTRCPVLEFSSEEEAEKAKRRIEEELYPEIKEYADSLMKEFDGRLGRIEIERKGRKLFSNFIFEMEGNYYGHEAATRNTDRIVERIILRELDADYLMLAGGMDGDLRPGKRNKRGRKVSASFLIPKDELEKIIPGASPERIEYLNRVKYWEGNELLGTYTHSGMELEVLEAYFNALEPSTPPFVSSWIDVRVESDKKGNLNYQVDARNFEGGLRYEAPISKVARECREILGGDVIRYSSVGTAILIPPGLNQHRLMHTKGLGATKKIIKTYDDKKDIWEV